MNILAASLIDNRNNAVLLNRNWQSGAFDSINDLRLALADIDFVPKGDLDDFGRGTQAVRRSQLCALLAAGDLAPLSLPVEKTAVIGWNGDGCLAENHRYWSDYTANNRQGGRGGLFVATLPTIPVGEAAITLGYQGFSVYLKTNPSTKELLKILSLRDEKFIMVIENTSQWAVAMIFENSSPETLHIKECESLLQLFNLMKNQ
jgi:hypothetical protein